jgi:hypothetical protein
MLGPKGQLKEARAMNGTLDTLGTKVTLGTWAP